MKHFNRIGLGGLSAFVLSAIAVSVMRLAEAAAPLPPATDLMSVFEGRFEGAGEIKDVKHPRPRSISFRGAGRRVGSSLQLHYDLVFSDGLSVHRDWAFEKTGEGRYIGRSDGLAAPADIVQDGGGFRFTYVAAENADGSGPRLTFSETYDIVGPGQIENKIEASLFKVPVMNGFLHLKKLGS